jgi:hypothetical protein
MPSRNSYVRYVADALESQLPENPVLCRRVLLLLTRRHRAARLQWVQMSLAATLACCIIAGATADTMPEDNGPEMIARIVHASDGLNYVVIYLENPGTPTKVLHRLRISPEEAVRRLKTPGWEDAARAAFRRL